MEVWRAIPDVLGSRLRFAQPAVEGECAPLLTYKYKPDVIETDRDIEVRNRMDKKHVKNTFFRFWGVSVTPPGYRNLAVAMFIKFGT